MAFEHCAPRLAQCTPLRAALRLGGLQAPGLGDSRHRFASQPLVSAVSLGNKEANLGKAAYCPRPRSIVQHNLRESSTQEATQ